MKAKIATFILIFSTFFSLFSFANNHQLSLLTFNTFSSIQYQYDQDFKDYLNQLFSQAGYDINIETVSLARMRSEQSRFDVLAPIPETLESKSTHKLAIIQTNMCLYATQSDINPELVAIRSGMPDILGDQESEQLIQISGQYVIERMIKFVKKNRAEGFIAVDILAPEIKQALPQLKCQRVLKPITGYLQLSEDIEPEVKENLSIAIKQLGYFRQTHLN